MSVLPHPHDPLRRRRAAAHRRFGRTAGNERLTGLTAVVLMMLLAAEAFTLTNVDGMLTMHMFVGLVLIPPLLLKLSSTGYRMFRYYTGHARYREKGPPAPLLRVIAPLLVIATLGLFGSGVAMLLDGHRSNLLLTIHQTSFYVWVALFAAHVLAYAPRVFATIAHDVRDAAGPARVPGSSLRASLVTAALGAGVALGLSALPAIAGFHRDFRSF
jgi:hypothetical protein